MNAALTARLAQGVGSLPATSAGAHSPAGRGIIMSTLSSRGFTAQALAQSFLKLTGSSGVAYVGRRLAAAAVGPAQAHRPAVQLPAAPAVPALPHRPGHQRLAQQVHLFLEGICTTGLLAHRCSALAAPGWYAPAASKVWGVCEWHAMKVCSVACRHGGIMHAILLPEVAFWQEVSWSRGVHAAQASPLASSREGGPILARTVHQPWLGRRPPSPLRKAWQIRDEQIKS